MNAHNVLTKANHLKIDSKATEIERGLAECVSMLANDVNRLSEQLTELRASKNELANEIAKLNGRPNPPTRG